MIDNPDYKGEWKPKQIPNPAYKGKWVHPKIANPEYSAEPLLYRYSDIGAIGLDLWQVKSGTIFDNILIGDDAAEAEAFAKETFEITKEAEKKMKDKQDEEEKAARDAEDAKKEDSETKEEDEEEEEDEEDEDDVPPEAPHDEL
jgi:calreticulin